MDGISGAYLRIGDNTQALEYQLKRLKIEEGRNRMDNIATIDMNIANIYNRNKDTRKAIHFILKTDSIINAQNFTYLKPYAYLNTGNIFGKADRLPEALNYTNQALEFSKLLENNLLVGTAFNNLGNIYYKLKKYELAVLNYKKSEPFMIEEKDNQTLTEGYIGLARSYLALEKQDSALHFARQSYNISYRSGLLNNALASSKFLSDYYRKNEKYDSALFYQTTMITLNDSIHSIEKIKQLESMSMQERIRQQKRAAMIQKEKEENGQRLQLLAIGILIPILFFFSIFISRRKVHRKLIQFCGVLSLLLLFEYITLFMHPFVAELTNHSPAIEIVIFVCVAALIVPAHHKIERWFTKQLATNYEHTFIKKEEVTVETKDFENSDVAENEIAKPKPEESNENSENDSSKDS